MQIQNAILHRKRKTKLYCACHLGSYLHGPYASNATPISIFEDFFRFCVLVARRKVVPNDWNWGAFLKKAVIHVRFAFEKSDAKERWGGETYFDGAVLGGRSLRYTGTVVYGRGVNYGEVCLRTHS